MVLLPNAITGSVLRKVFPGLVSTKWLISLHTYRRIMNVHKDIANKLQGYSWKEKIAIRKLTFRENILDNTRLQERKIKKTKFGLFYIAYVSKICIYCNSNFPYLWFFGWFNATAFKCFTAYRAVQKSIPGNGGRISKLFYSTGRCLDIEIALMYSQT